MDFSRQEYWNELPFPSAGDLPDGGFEPRSPALLADSLPSELPGKPIHFSFLPTSEWKLKMNMKVKTPGKKKKQHSACSVSSAPDRGRKPKSTDTYEKESYEKVLNILSDSSVQSLSHVRLFATP